MYDPVGVFEHIGTKNVSKTNAESTKSMFNLLTVSPLEEENKNNIPTPLKLYTSASPAFLLASNHAVYKVHAKSFQSYIDSFKQRVKIVCDGHEFLYSKVMDLLFEKKKLANEIKQSSEINNTIIRSKYSNSNDDCVTLVNTLSTNINQKHNMLFVQVNWRRWLNILQKQYPNVLTHPSMNLYYMGIFQQLIFAFGPAKAEPFFKLHNRFSNNHDYNPNSINWDELSCNQTNNQQVHFFSYQKTQITSIVQSEINIDENKHVAEVPNRIGLKDLLKITTSSIMEHWTVDIVHYRIHFGPAEIYTVTTRGGVMADLVGRGKTLTMHAAIQHDILYRQQKDPLFNECDNSNETKHRRKYRYTKHINPNNIKQIDRSFLTDNDSFGDCNVITQATLWVCPGQLVQQVANECSKHLGLNCVIIRNVFDEKKISQDTLLSSDIVITTFDYVDNIISHESQTDFSTINYHYDIKDNNVCRTKCVSDASKIPYHLGSNIPSNLIATKYWCTHHSVPVIYKRIPVPVFEQEKIKINKGSKKIKLTTSKKKAPGTVTNENTNECSGEDSSGDDSSVDVNFVKKRKHSVLKSTQSKIKQKQQQCFIKLSQIYWRRIVVDEFHQPSRNFIQKLMSLASRYRWAVTGTPYHEDDVIRFSGFLNLQISNPHIGVKCFGPAVLSIWDDRTHKYNLEGDRGNEITSNMFFINKNKIQYNHFLTPSTNHIIWLYNMKKIHSSNGTNMVGVKLFAFHLFPLEYMIFSKIFNTFGFRYDGPIETHSLIEVPKPKQLLVFVEPTPQEKLFNEIACLTTQLTSEIALSFPIENEFFGNSYDSYYLKLLQCIQFLYMSIQSFKQYKLLTMLDNVCSLLIKLFEINNKPKTIVLEDENTHVPFQYRYLAKYQNGTQKGSAYIVCRRRLSSQVTKLSSIQWPVAVCTCFEHPWYYEYENIEFPITSCKGTNHNADHFEYIEKLDGLPYNTQLHHFSKPSVVGLPHHELFVTDPDHPSAFVIQLTANNVTEKNSLLAFQNQYFKTLKMEIQLSYQNNELVHSNKMFTDPQEAAITNILSLKDDIEHLSFDMNQFARENNAYIYNGLSSYNIRIQQYRNQRSLTPSENDLLSYETLNCRLFIVSKYVKNIIETNPDSRILLLTSKPELKRVIRALFGIENVAVCDGTTAAKLLALKKFQNGTAKILLLNKQRTATGADLQMATHCLTLHASDESNAETSEQINSDIQFLARAYRIGQTKSVMFIRIAVHGADDMRTLEQSVLAIKKHYTINNKLQM